MTTIDLQTLRAAVRDDGVALRSIVRLEPAGGSGDKIFPPTYIQDGRKTKYAFETRRIDGSDVPTVLLDSVASQANRHEEALLEARRRERLKFPLVEVSFSGAEGLEDLESISALEAPHRIADALLRDALLDGVPFRHSPVGEAITNARPDDATAMYRYCPTALIFGVWDSTGPKGGLGAKYARALVSEIVGVNALAGVKTASRIDPAGIEKKAGPVYQHPDPREDWTLDEESAEKDKKGKPIVHRGEGKGSPAAINHGNIPPSVDSIAGGVTIDYAVHTTIVSIPALRRLRFRTAISGDVIEPGARADAETAARTLLAALALAASAHHRDRGYDLRSRSLLVPSEEASFELIRRTGARERFELDSAAADALVAQAEASAQEHGLGWDVETVTLIPAPKLVQLIRKSRELVRAGEDDE